MARPPVPRLCALAGAPPSGARQCRFHCARDVSQNPNVVGHDTMLRSYFCTPDSDDSSWSCTGLVIITHGVTMMENYSFPRRTVEEKRTAFLKSQDDECS
ncbi:hypothetical protein EVAR_39118_1 [Eumeta japonica]|uniref:Uncharacterized protein n=1 Tax=Eumeta variegata TaxID=151549 RepID=A0A4C1X3X5_EUMVA|nr:hypothetical protein EVAR_39118_1 [Eumeta japonica]